MKSTKECYQALIDGKTLINGMSRVKLNSLGEQVSDNHNTLPQGGYLFNAAFLWRTEEKFECEWRISEDKIIYPIGLPPLTDVLESFLNKKTRITVEVLD